jgi:hypothetical protein
LGFVEKYYKNPELVTTLKFKNDVENSFQWISKNKEDIFVMSFYGWLKSKMENKDLYMTTLDFVRNSKKTNC